MHVRYQQVSLIIQSFVFCKNPISYPLVPLFLLLSNPSKRYWKLKKSVINWTRKYETPLLTTNRITTAGSVYQNCIGATVGSWLRRCWKALFSHSLVVTSTQFAVGLPDFTRLKHTYRNICKSTLRGNTNTLKLFELNCWLQNVSHNSSIPVEICSFYLQV